jgi:hypothetical protein
LDPIEAKFLAMAVGLLRDDYLPKIAEAVGLLSDDEVWWREADNANSIGNLLMHLSGNIQQHIVAGLGTEPDERNRPLEFAARGGISKNVLLAELETTVADACSVLLKFEPARLVESRMIQNNRVVVFDDLAKTLAHFAYHTGQIIYIVKARKHHSFPWYKHLDPN